MSMSSSVSGSGATTTGGRTPVSRVMVNGIQVDVKATGMAMVRNHDQHDAVALSLSSSTLPNTDGLKDQPISFIYGLSPRTEFFFGYIVEVSEEQANNANLTFTLQIVGTTLAMQQGRPRFWPNKTIPSLVSDLVNANLLGAYVTGPVQTWNGLAQTEESDWQIAVELAGRIGFVLFNWNGVVICAEPMTLYNSQGPYTQLISQTNVDSGQWQLLEFTPSDTSEQTYTGMGIKFAYLASNQQVAWAEEPNKTNFHFVSSLPVRSQEEAETYLNALTKGLTNWHKQSSARIKGDALIYPGVCVEIVTSDATRDKSFDGKWLVLGVQHKMDNQSFQTQLSLSRPDSNTITQISPYKPFWDLAGKGKPTMWLNGTRWMSSWSDNRLRSVVA